jgi:PBSX family phage terminase large subunit
MTYKPCGILKSAWPDKSPEICIFGGAGTGKTRMILERLYRLCLKYPGSKHLILRKTRISMNHSVLDTFERFVLPESLYRNQKRNLRQFYAIGKSQIVLGCADEITRIMGSEYATIFIDEATEITYDDYLHLLTRLRDKSMPWQQMVIDCNPSSNEHWIKVREREGKIKLYQSVKTDNPYLPQDYFESLGKSLGGYLRARLYEGIWCAAEGSIYPEFTIENPPKDILPTCAGVDFGYRDPTAIVWLAKQDGITWAVDEYQESSHTLNFHMPQFKKYNCEYLCDPSRPDSIAEMQNAGVNAYGADNSLDRISKINVAFSLGKLKISPKCEKLISSLKSYVWKKCEDNHLVKEVPAPSTQDHLCDALRYAFQDEVALIYAII